LAPSTELRKWFGHDPEKWSEFRKRYEKELSRHKQALMQISEEAKKGTVTLVYGAKDQEHNDAVVLADVIEKLNG
jgi:uncharacterized protein YeaO (DUF488 family)